MRTRQGKGGGAEVIVDAAPEFGRAGVDPHLAKERRASFDVNTATRIFISGAAAQTCRIAIDNGNGFDGG